MEKWQEYVFTIVTFIVFVAFIISIIVIMKKFYKMQEENKKLHDENHNLRNVVNQKSMKLMLKKFELKNKLK
jgi:uncharacterized membrane protein YdbT with pleckstrin-like domain